MRGIRWNSALVRVALCLFSGTLATGSGAMASPWGQAPGERLTIYAVDQFSATGQNGEFEQFSSSTYTEIGLPMGLTVTGKLGWGQQNVPTVSGDHITREGVTDAEISLQRGLWTRGGHRLAGYASYAPGTTMVAANQAIAGNQTNGRDSRAGLGLSYGYGGQKMFATASASHHTAFGDDANQWRFQTSIGRHHKHAMLLLETYGQLAQGPAQPGGNDFDVMSVSASAAIKIRQRHRLQFGVARDIYGRNTDKGTRLFLALWFET